MESKQKFDGYSLMAKMRKARREYPLTSTEQALYYELLAICNEGGWTEVFSCSCAELCYTLQITNNTLVKARMSLINAGLISYKSGKSRRQFSSYSFTSVSKFDIDVGRDKGTDRGRDRGTDVDENVMTNIKDKQKTKTQTKQNNSFSGGKAPGNKKDGFEKVLYWQKIVDAWFSFYKKNYVIEPTFNGAAAKNLKLIVESLKKLADKSVPKYEWTEEYALKVINHFFTKAFAVEWLRDNYLLSNLYSKFDSIVQKDNERNNTTKQSTGANVNTGSMLEKINAMPD